MTDTNNDGGAAFPREARTEDNGPGFYKTVIPAADGMSLRDYFAAKAMQGMLANSGYHFDGVGDPKQHSERAYEYADAMLKARG